MKRIRCRFWGTRGSMAAPGKQTGMFGGNTNCLEIRTARAHLICDAGTGIRVLGNALQKEFKGKSIDATILLSHVHWDHYIGLPFFKPLFFQRNRIVIAGPRFGARSFERVMDAAICPPYFPIRMKDFSANVRWRTVGGRRFHVGDIGVVPIEAHHPGGACGWRFEFEDGRALCLMTDNEPFHEEHQKKLCSWMGGAEVLIHDAQFSPETYQRRQGWGHSPFTYPIELAKKSGVKALYLTHYDPDDDDQVLRARLKRAREYARKIGCKSKIDAAREHLTFQL